MTAIISRRRGAKVGHLQHHYFTISSHIMQSLWLQYVYYSAAVIYGALTERRNYLFMAQYNLPDGITLEQLDAYARERENARRRADYAKHPERIERQRVNTYRNFLTRRGYLVIAPEDQAHG